ncbi:MAG TPA: hypothetical protein VEX43_06050 [Chthoniobacterales bacterium]|nr:hypothetical protein [Chthoniobacterales bacterium]
MNEARRGPANCIEQKESEPRQLIVASGENPHVCPGIEIVLNRQQEDVFVSAPVAKLGEIRVLFPADTAQQCSIDGMKRDEITAAAMVRADDEFLRRQLRESALDIARPKPRTIPTDRDNFVVAKLRDSLDRVFQARREISARLSVNAGPGRDWIAGGSEKMNIDLRGHFGFQARDTQKRSRRLGESTPRQIDVDFVGKYENSSSGHAFGYETEKGGDKPFSCSRFAVRSVCLSPASRRNDGLGGANSHIKCNTAKPPLAAR